MNTNTVRYVLALLLLVLAFQGGGGIIPNPISPKPIDLPGSNVLVLTDTSTGSVIDLDSLRAVEVESFLKANNVKMYVWDDSTTNFDFVPKEWKDAFQKAVEDSGGVRPWILVSGSGGSSEALPEASGDVLRLLERYIK